MNDDGVDGGKDVRVKDDDDAKENDNDNEDESSDENLREELKIVVSDVPTSGMLLETLR